MVEVFDFQKNFETGKEIRKSKFKDNAMTKGVATIELFDKNNNLVEKTVSNNFINNPFDSDYMYRHMAHLLAKNSYSHSNILNSEQFGQIHLRNGDFEEDKNALFMKGNLVGWSPRTSTDAGADTTRGVYNTNESFEEFTEDGYYHAHLVYDFLTSQANGTISHVYWTPTVYNNTYPALTCLSPLRPRAGYFGLSFSSSFDLKMDVKEDLYCYINPNYYKVENKYMVLNGFEEPVFDMNQPVNSIKLQQHRINSDLYVDFEVDYGAGGSSTRKSNLTLKLISTHTDEVQKTVSFDMINDFAGMKNWSDSTTTSSANTYISRIVTSNESGNVYMSMYVAGGSLPVVNQDGSLGSSANSRTYTVCYNILKDTWTIQPNIKDYVCYSLGSVIPVGASVKIDDNKYFILANSNQRHNLVLINEENFLTSSYPYSHFSNYSSSSVNGIDSYINYLVGYSYETNTCIGFGTNKSSVVLNRFLPYSSHTKLPSPVTKTNTTTMKVTYDYYIQMPNLFAGKGKEFDWGQE